MSGRWDGLQPGIAPGTVVVTDNGEGPFGQALLDGRHVLVADEPLSVGGRERGPNPYELLLMSLGACTSMTLRLYANRKKWPLEHVVVRLHHGKAHAEDCADCESRSAMIDRIESKIELVGELDETQRARLLEIAEMCPVHRTLTGKIEIRTTWRMPDPADGRFAIPGRIAQAAPPLDGRE
jgi:putative redox protein